MAWKREMRMLPVLRWRWPRFDYTVAIIKPQATLEQHSQLLAGLDRFRPVRKVTRWLSLAEVMFLYSTAYGRIFTQQLISYHTSGPSEIVLLASPDIVREQYAFKLALRRAVGVEDLRRSLIHLPDSLADTYANIACLFGEELLTNLIRQCYDSGR